MAVRCSAMMLARANRQSLTNPSSEIGRAEGTALRDMLAVVRSTTLLLPRTWASTPAAGHCALATAFPRCPRAVLAAK